VRIGAVADIHGNLAALDAVLADLEQAGVDQLVCLGDVAVLGPEPSSVIARLRAIDCPCVMGNTDAWLLPDPPIPAEPATTKPVADLTRWCADQLSTDDISYLRELPLTQLIPLGNDRTLLAYHASPRSLDDVIAATTDRTSLVEMLEDQSANIYAGGHTHIQLLRRHENARIINPGSVGLPGVGPGGPNLPVNTGVTWAEYAILDVSQQTVSIEFRQIPLDLQEMRRRVIISGMPHGDWWLTKWEFT
jgi:putative phosphoesterase